MLINSRTTSTSSNEVLKKKLRQKYRSKIERLRSDREIGKLSIIIGNTGLLPLSGFICLFHMHKGTVRGHKARAFSR